jgi:hypothetical protein
MKSLNSAQRMPCRRASGTFRAHFETREQAAAFANDPQNHPVYKDDIARLCPICGWWHLYRAEWLIENWKAFENSPRQVH